jgi:uncharacterized protein (DUF983 family)
MQQLLPASFAAAAAAVAAVIVFVMMEVTAAESSWLKAGIQLSMVIAPSTLSGATTAAFRRSASC